MLGTRTVTSTYNFTSSGSCACPSAHPLELICFCPLPERIHCLQGYTVRCFVGDNEERWYMWYSGRKVGAPAMDLIAPSSGSLGEGCYGNSHQGIPVRSLNYHPSRSPNAESKICDAHAATECNATA
eukprot:1151445-Pelagomonas_calceolata.AAC.4